MKLCKRTAEEKRRENFCDKRDNNFTLLQTDLFLENQNTVRLSEDHDKNSQVNPVTFVSHPPLHPLLSFVFLRKLSNQGPRTGTQTTDPVIANFLTRIQKNALVPPFSTPKCQKEHSSLACVAQQTLCIPYKDALYQ